MIRKLKSIVGGMRNTIQDTIEAKQAIMAVGISAVLQTVEQPKPGLFHRDAKYRVFVRKVLAKHRSKKLHKAILAGKAPRGRTV